MDVDVHAALRLQVEWGADEALLDHAVDRRAARAPAPAGARLQQSPAPPPRAARPPLPVRDGVTSAWTAEEAQVLAATAQNFDALADILAGFDPDGLPATATNLVRARGDATYGLAIIGDTPGDEEDRSGEPFGGPAGALLTRMLASIGLDRGQLLLTHLLPWRPPGGRPASEREIATYAPFLHRTLALGGATRLLLIGTAATRAFLGRDASLTRVRGRWHDATVTGFAHPLPVLPTHAPAQLLDRPELKAFSWIDLRLLRRTLDQG